MNEKLGNVEENQVKRKNITFKVSQMRENEINNTILSNRTTTTNNNKLKNLYLDKNS